MLIDVALFAVLIQPKPKQVLKLTDILPAFILVYLALTLAVGFWAARKIKTSSDFTLAGRSLSALVVGVIIFATWFGPEMIMGLPALFANEGMMGIIADQFGAPLCLVLVGLFYARKIYQLNIVTVNDFFRIRFNSSIEVFSSLIMVATYFHWIAAQFLALAILETAIDATLLGTAASFVTAVTASRLYPDNSGAYFVEREQASAILQSP